MSSILITQVARSTPFDNTGINYTSTDVQGALAELRAHPEFDNLSTASTVNGTLTLTSSSNGMQIITGTATGFSVVMPSALTLYSTAIGSTYYQIANTSTQSITVKDGSGATLFTLAANSMGFLWLQAQGSAAGTWIYTLSNFSNGNGPQLVTYNITSNTAFASSASVDTLITGMTVTPVSGTYSIWYNAQNTATGSGQQMDCTVYNGAAAVADSVRSNLSTSGTHIFQNSTQTSSQFNGTNAATIKVNPNGNSITVGARSMLMIRTGN